MSEAPLQGRGVKAGLAYGFLNNLTLRVGNLLLGVLLARLLAPEDFGVFAVALTVQVVLANLTDLGMTAYLVQAPDVRRPSPTVLTIGLGVGVGLAALMAACAHSMAVQLGSVDAVPVIQVLSLTLILSGVGSVPTAVIQRRFQQGRQLIADGASFVVGNTVAVGMILAGAGVMSLAWSRVLGQLTAVVVLFVLSRYRDGFGFDRAVSRDAYRFGLPLVAANVVSWVLLNTDYVLIGHMLGATELGFYVLAFNISSWPTSAITQSLRAVALPAFARAQESSRANHTELVSSAVGLTLAASAPIGALLMALATPVVIFVYGPKWADSVAPLAVLAAFGAVRPVFDLMSTYLTARGATRSVLAVQVLWVVTLAAALWVGISLRGIFGAGLAHLVVGTLLVLPAYLFALHRGQIRILRIFATAVAPVTLAAAAGALAFGVARLFDSPLTAVLVAGSLATAAYLVAVHRYVRARQSDLRSWKATGSETGPEPRRFLIVTHEASLSGAPRIALLVARTLADQGHMVEVMSRRPGPLLVEFRTTAAARIEPLYRVRSRLWRTGRMPLLALAVDTALAALSILWFRPDVVYVNSTSAAVYLTPALWLRRTVILHGHESAEIARRFLRQARAVPRLHRVHLVGCSPTVRDALAELAGMPTPSITMIPSVPDGPQVLEQSRQGPDWCPGPDEIVIGCCGSVESRKGTDLWLEAAELVREALPGTALRFVWIGEVTDSDLAVVRPDVTFLGPSTNPYPVMRRFDLATLPSRDDPFPLVVLESMLLGRPVVAFDVGGVAEQVGDGGIIVPAGDVTAFAEAVIRLVRDRREREDLGLRAERRARVQFSVDAFSRAVLQVVGDGPAPGPTRRAVWGRVPDETPVP